MAARLNKWTIHKIDERIDRQRVEKSHDKNRNQLQKIVVMIMTIKKINNKINVTLSIYS